MSTIKIRNVHENHPLTPLLVKAGELLSFGRRRWGRMTK